MILRLHWKDKFSRIYQKTKSWFVKWSSLYTLCFWNIYVAGIFGNPNSSTNTPSCMKERNLNEISTRRNVLQEFIFFIKQYISNCHGDITGIKIKAFSIVSYSKAPKQIKYFLLFLKIILIKFFFFFNFFILIKSCNGTLKFYLQCYQIAVIKWCFSSLKYNVYM